MRKLIALDIDGTLVNDQKEITPKTLAALHQAQALGHVVVLASGRPTAGLFHLSELLHMNQHHGLLLAYNGGVVTDATSLEVLLSHTVSLPLAKRLLRFLEDFDVVPLVDDGVKLYTDNPNGMMVEYERSSNNLALEVVDNLCDALDFAPAKVLISADPVVITEKQDDMAAPFLEELSFIQSAPFYYEATPLGVHKADSLAQVCKHIGIDQADVIAFGDAQNDLSMITFAGVGVAMGNACDALKAIANKITASNNDDGIAVALEELGVI